MMNTRILIALAFLTFVLWSPRVAESEPIGPATIARTASCGLSLSAISSGRAFQAGSSYDVLIRLTNHTSQAISLSANPWLSNLKLFNSRGNVAVPRPGVVAEYDGGGSVSVPSGTNDMAIVGANGTLDYHVNLGDRYSRIMAGTYKFAATVKVEEVRAVGADLGIFLTNCELVDPNPSIVVQ